ncbi:hypothetical protein [Streptomyces sp. NPDC059080]|uniref:hypothetical protein n=1 Tax=Streptomyces sp. NPDC059080 TaxID=3346718 RepID=UPI0036C535E1
MSPYAREASEAQPFLDTVHPVRPYLTASPRRRPTTPEEQAGAHRLWVLDMALRGIDVGPSKIHGVHVGPKSRTIHLAMAG